MKGSEIIAKALKDKGIKTVYLFPGGTIAPLLDDLVKIGIDYVCMKHEQGAGFAAIGAAKESNDPQVVLVTSGPGATNLLTCIITDLYHYGFSTKKSKDLSKSSISWLRKEVMG